MKKALTILGVILITLILGFGCSGNGGGGGGNGGDGTCTNFAGTWEGSAQVHAEDCGEGTYGLPFKVTVKQNGCSIAVVSVEPPTQFSGSGSVSGNTATWSGQYDDGEGNVSIKITLTISGDTATGSATWSWKSYNGQETCSGTSNISAERTSGGEPPPGGGTAPYIDSYTLLWIDVICADQYGDDYNAILNNCAYVIQPNGPVYIGDLYAVAYLVYDPDLDMDTLEYWQYRSTGGGWVLEYHDVNQLEWFTPPADPAFIYVWAVIEGPAGLWRVDTQITDKANNKSNVYSFQAEVYDTPQSSVQSFQIEPTPDEQLTKDLKDKWNHPGVIKSVE